MLVVLYLEIVLIVRLPRSGRGLWPGMSRPLRLDVREGGELPVGRVGLEPREARDHFPLRAGLDGVWEVVSCEWVSRVPVDLPRLSRIGELSEHRGSVEGGYATRRVVGGPQGSARDREGPVREGLGRHRGEPSVAHGEPLRES